MYVYANINVLSVVSLQPIIVGKRNYSHLKAYRYKSNTFSSFAGTDMNHYFSSLY